MLLYRSVFYIPLSYLLKSVNDVDDDVIRCRWATPNGINGDECGDVCSAFSGLVVNEVGLEIIIQVSFTANFTFYMY